MVAVFVSQKINAIRTRSMLIVAAIPNQVRRRDLGGEVFYQTTGCVVNPQVDSISWEHPQVDIYLVTESFSFGFKKSGSRLVNVWVVQDARMHPSLRIMYQ